MDVTEENHACIGTNIEKNTIVVEGVLFRRSIRSNYASLDIAVKQSQVNNDFVQNSPPPPEYKHVVIYLEFGAEKQLRSEVRRFCRVGDFIKAKGKFNLCEKDVTPPDKSKKLSRPQRFNVDELSNMELRRQNYWDASDCQKIKNLFCPELNMESQMNHGSKTSKKSNKIKNSMKSKSAHSGGGVGKRKQGEILANFFVNCVADMLKRKSSEKSAIEFLNDGSGVIDAAGGSGHVSLALSLLGIQSTVIDPRESVGRLPMRDRKVFRKAKRAYDQLTQVETSNESTTEMSPFIGSQTPPPPLPFAFKRAWFMNKPEGVDTVYRENQSSSENTNESGTEMNSIPICSMCSPDRLLPNCKAVIALHPDEATELIIDFAIKYRIPFVVVPCCVFSRLFPMRMWKGSTVTTYKDFLDYLVAKDASIQVSKLQFDGMNTAVWSVFE